MKKRTIGDIEVSGSKASDTTTLKIGKDHQIKLSRLQLFMLQSTLQQRFAETQARRNLKQW